MLPRNSCVLLSSLAAAAMVSFPGDLAAADKVIAYQVPANTEGNQAFGGTLGMDFEVANPIVVTRIGVFDDLGDGLKLPITAKIWDRSDPDAPVALVTVEFTPEDPGELVGGSRFKVLQTPLRLEIGFRGTMGAEGYGADERLRNAGIGPRNWTVGDGAGSLVFVGGSRYGTANGEYPNVADGGPADRYAAGTFEFETTAPVKPGAPGSLVAIPKDSRIGLAWSAVTAPLAAAKYEIWRAAPPTADFTKVGESTTTDYVDFSIANGALACYRVRGIGAGGQVGVDSARICAAPYKLPENQNVAFLVNAGIPGTQNFGGVIGMDFDVVNAIEITHLGVFDDGSDGLARPIVARLWDRSNPDAPTELTSVEFTSDSPGELVGATRFKALNNPVRLEAKFKGTISAENYGAEERLVNPGGNPNVVRPWSVNAGMGSIRLVGTGRYGLSPGEYPGTSDAGAPDRYGAGNFQFRTTALTNPGVPVVSTSRGDRAVHLAWASVVEPVAASKYRVRRRVGDGASSQVAELTDLAYHDEGLTKGTAYCYTVAAVTAAGVEGVESTESCQVVEAREPGIAYLVEAGTVGNQAFGGALGMHFDVLGPIRVTRLGVFDDSSDGIFVPISARLYDRSTRQVVAELMFTPEDFGELIGGSRFKNLAQPVVLPVGFQGTMVASGYGGDERNGNGVAGRTVYTAAGALAFVGTAAYNPNGADFPSTADGGPANRYAAGTFYFEPIAVPVVRIARSAGKVVLSWTGAGTLESATSIRGPWAAVAGAASGIAVDATAPATFYRIRQ